MSDDKCPDFDSTLRTMLATPPTPHQRKPEPTKDDGDDQVEADEEGGSEADESDA